MTADWCKLVFCLVVTICASCTLCYITNKWTMYYAAKDMNRTELKLKILERRDPIVILEGDGF